MLRFVEGTNDTEARPPVPTLACEVSGEGPPVVLLHGVGGGRNNWRRQRQSLQGSFTTFAWDARGYGDSGDVPGPRHFSDFGDDLERLLNHFAIEQAHLVGLSMGARILMEFASRRLDRVATLTLCDCFYGFRNALSPEKQAEYIELRERPLQEGKTFADLAPKLIESLVGPRASEEARAELRDSLLALRAESYLKTIRASVTFNQADELHALAVPVQLIFGAEDRLTPPSIGYEMLDLLPDATLAVLDDAGHLANLEAPEAFNHVLASFLARHRDRASFRAVVQSPPKGSR
ncbi:MAG: alpha/beta fold hydrolase [Acidimicrobiia bacterium]|nr:alpha/beta fold hydrolase [Acidimicrobiia bacterium]